MNTEKIKQLDEEIKLLQKEKEKALLQQEIEKIKKTVVEETIIKRKIIKYPCPCCPVDSPSPFSPQTWITTTDGYFI